MTSIPKKAKGMIQRVGKLPFGAQATKQRSAGKHRNGVAPTYPDGLTKRQVEVLCLFATDMTTKEVAAKLGISGSTVYAHKSAIESKTDLITPLAMRDYAEKHGLFRTGRRFSRGG